MDDSPTPTTPAYVPPTEEKKAFLAALAAAQGEYLPIVRNRNVKIVGKTKDGERIEYTFKYAELSEIFEKTRPALAKNGLSLRSSVLPHKEPGHIWLQSVLAHAQGFEDIVEIAVAVAGDIKLFGGQLSYLRRYLASGQLGIASEDDDESATEAGTQNIGGGRAAAPAPRARPQPAPRPAAPPPKQAEASAGPNGAETVSTVLPDSDAPEAGECILPAQAKWVTAKLSANFDAATAAEWLEAHGLPKNVDLMPAARFESIRGELVKL